MDGSVLMPASLQTTQVLPTNLEADNPLWRFALAVWREPLAQKICLDLQTEGWSVTRILCAGWLALSGRTYTGVEPLKVTEWRERVTVSLRTVRKALPKEWAPCATLRARLADLELDAERIELALAWHTLAATHPDEPDMSEPETVIQSNLAAAAPASAISPASWRQVSALGDILATFQQGETQP